MYPDDLKSALPGASSSLTSDPFSSLRQDDLKKERDGSDNQGMTPSPAPSRKVSTTSSNKSRFSMRIPIRVQLALLVLITSMLGLAVIALATWFYNLDFVINIKSQGLTLAASLKAAQIASDLRLIQSTCATISSRILIQSALQRYYAGNTTADNWVRALTDVQSALAIGGYTDLLQVKIFSRNGTGDPLGLLNATASGAPDIALPYNYSDGSAVMLGDPYGGYPPSLYPNLTYVTNGSIASADPIAGGADAYAFPDYKFNLTSALLLGPMHVNETFALVSITLPIINVTSSTNVLGYLTVVADASSLYNALSAREGLGNTGLALLIGPASPENHFPIGAPSANGRNTPNNTALGNVRVNYVFPPMTLPDQVDRHPGEWSTIDGTSFPLSRYPGALEAFSATTPDSDLSSTNEQGTSVAVAWARPQTNLADWVLLVEQSHDEAWAPVTQLRKILLACVFGTIGFIMIIVVPMAHFSVLPISRLKDATLLSVAPPGCSEDGSIRSCVIEDDDISGDEENMRTDSPTLTKKKGGFIVRMRDLTRGRRRKSRAEKAEDARRRAFKIPAKVHDKKHFVTDELTELTKVFNEMSDELTSQYSRLEDRVAERTQQLEISKKAAEAANESKTLFIANISHELKTPLNGILGLCAVCMQEDDLPKIKKSLQIVYKSGDLLLNLLNDLLLFSKNQIGQVLTLEEKEFGLSDIKLQVATIFEQQVREAGINFSVNFVSTDYSDAVGHSEEFVPTFSEEELQANGRPARATGPVGTGKLKDMRLWGDFHRILQVVINLVSNSLKFTPHGGRVEVRVRCLGEVDTSRNLDRDSRALMNDRDSRNSVASKQGSQQRTSRHPTRPASGSNQSTGSKMTSTVPSRVASSSGGPAFGTALLINPMAPKAAQSHVVRERAPTPPPANAKVLIFEFSVEDTGPGISPALQERVFEPFMQGDLGLNKKFGGTGLGLSICSQLAGLMGGKMSLESAVGVGTTFKMEIPLKFVKERVSSTASSSVAGSRAPSISHDTAASHPGRRSTETPPPALALDTVAAASDANPRLVGLRQPFFASSPDQSSGPADQLSILDNFAANTNPFHKIRVLVAEDNLVNQEVVLRMLKLEDVYDVTVAKDGQEAFDKVKASMENGEGYNLIFMDVQMPNLDGLQSTRMIRSMGYNAPIVALTAFAEESNVKECMDSGMDMFLSKPIRRPALKQVLKKFATIPEEASDAASLTRKLSGSVSPGEQAGQQPLLGSETSAGNSADNAPM